MNQAITDALVPYGTVAQRDAAIAAALAAYYTSAQTDAALAAALLHLGPDGRRHRGGAGAEQRPDLERRADVQPAPGQQRAPKPLGGRRPERQLPELGRHHPHRIRQLRPQRDLYASGNGRSDHGCPRCPQLVPVPDRGAGAGPTGTRERSRPTWRASWPTTPPAAR